MAELRLEMVMVTMWEMWFQAVRKEITELMCLEIKKEDG